MNDLKFGPYTLKWSKKHQAHRAMTPMGMVVVYGVEEIYVDLNFIGSRAALERYIELGRGRTVEEAISKARKAYLAIARRGQKALEAE